MPRSRTPPSVTAETSEKIKAVFTVVDGLPVWQERTADFYRTNFPRAFDPEGAAEEWNAERAGNPPRWQFVASRGDYVCNAWQRQVSLREVCETFALPYLALREEIASAAKQEYDDRTRCIVMNCVELQNGEPVWKRRTRKTHPKTDMDKLDAFNRDFAGKKLRLRDGKFYLVTHRKVQKEDMMKWLKEG